MESILLQNSVTTQGISTDTHIRLCENCDTPVTGKFCANCGQEHDPAKVHFKDFIIDYAKSLINIDSKSFKSLRLLVFKPGILAAQYIQGKRASFIKPSELYLFMSVIFFYFVSSYDPVTIKEAADMIHKPTLDAIYASKKISIDHLNELFESKIQDKLPTFLIAIVPTLALFLGLFYNRKKYFFVHHLSFSYHFFAFMFLTLIPSTFNEDIATLAFFGWFGYLVFAMKKAYEQNYVITTLKASLIWLAVIFLLYGYLYLAVNYSIAEINTELGV